jgi:hypothetical protein
MLVLTNQTMTNSIRARPLTKKEMEDSDFCSSDVGRKVVSLRCNMSVMGPARHCYIATQRIDVSSQWSNVNLGGGQYLFDGPSPPPATGGRIVPILWGEDFRYLRVAARDLGIPVFEDGVLLYFESIYENAFLDGFSYTDRTLYEMNKKSFFSFWGGGIPDWGSKESNAIKEEVRKILQRAMRL